MYLPSPDDQAALAAMAQANPQPDTSGLTADTSQQLPALGAASPPVTPQAPVQAPVSTTGYQVASNAAPAAGYAGGVNNFENGGNPNSQNATNPITGAHGNYQFLPTTFKSVIAAHPELAGLSDSDPKVLAAFTQDNAKILTAGLGHAPDQMDLMAAHFLGATGAVTFLKAYSANPNTSVVGVVSPAALAANKGVFYNADGSAKSVGQVYNETATKVGAATGATGNAGATGTPGQPGAPGANPYAQQGSDINSFIAGQPGMWAKLQSLQDQYKQAAQPTWQQKMTDAINGMQQQQAVANANMHANAGAIMTHSAQPDASQFVGALQSAHNMDVAERQRDLDYAKTNYEMGASTLQAKNAQQLSNLGLTGALAAQIANYGVDQRKLGQTDTQLGIEQQKANTEATSVGNNLTVKMLEYGATQSKAFQDALNQQVPDVAAQAEVMKRFLAGGGNPQAALNQNLAKLNGIITDYIAGKPAAAPSAATGTTPPVGGAPAPLNAPATPVTAPGALPGQAATPPAQMGNSIAKPGKQLLYTWYDPTTGQPQRRTVDENNPSDMNWVRTQKPPEAQPVDLGAPSTTINTGTTGTGNGGDLADQHMTAIQLKQDADAALSFLPYLQQHGGTGVLTGAQGTAIANGIKQATGYDPTGVPVREIYDKLMTRIQTGLTLPQMKQMGGRPAAAEFNVLMKGQIGDTATIPAVQSFLQHVSSTADWTQRSVEAQSNAAMLAKQQNNPYFDPTNARIQWQKNPANQPPVWDGQSLIDAVDKANQAPVGTPQGNPTPLVSQTTTNQFLDWAKNKIGMPTSTGAPTPATPPTTGLVPLTPQDLQLFNGGR